MGSSTGNRRFIALLLGGALALLSGAAVSDSAVVKGSKAAGLSSCVAPTADMRRNHMDYLKHDRVEVVRQGIRDNRFSLAECVNCHAGKDGEGHPVPVNAEGQFCDTCHDYAAVDIACFQCHRKVPQE